MQKLTRRTFARRILAAGLLPSSVLAAKEDPQSQDKPLVAGYAISREESELAAKFLTEHDKNMEGLKARDLPNSLPPYFCLALTPREGKKS